MPKSVRIKTTVKEDKNIQVRLEQDFDLLEILSLKISKSDVYNRMCADYGVVVGRALANGGFGVPNAKISVFIPITEEDENDPVISELYPYKTVTDKNEEGYRYNLLPKLSDGCNHNATGNFFTADEVINNPIVLEIFEKYYKYTTKTNESGDFMIWGVPLGTQTIHASIDVSNIGCYSMRPYHFINQGRSATDFKSALEFKTSENLDNLPQIIIQNKVVEVIPFWGDENLCEIGISRSDFDLRDSGVEIIPSATFLGSIITDDDSNFVSVNGVPAKYQGQLCNLTTGTGLIEAVRHTILFEEDGCTPKLEYFALEKGGKVIDGNGAWVTQLPMNLDFIITNEYGEQVISDDPKKGIPTKAKYRFRISFDSVGSDVRNASYLVPNIREYIQETDPSQLYDNPITQQQYSSPSYTFSDKLVDYPLVGAPKTWENSPAYTCEDYFYEFAPNTVYTVASFIDNYRKNVDSSADPSFSPNNRWKFIGIKSINPPAENRCTDSTKEFPINDAFRGGTTFFTQQQISRIFQMITIILSAIAIGLAGLLLVLQFSAYALDGANTMGLWIYIYPFAAGLAVYIGNWIAILIMLILLSILVFKPMLKVLFENFYITKKIYNYPNCEPCTCGPPYTFWLPPTWQNVGSTGKLQEAFGDDPASVSDCTMLGFKNNALFWRGRKFDKPPGCYVLTWDPKLVERIFAVIGFMIGCAAIPPPYGGPVFAIYLIIALFKVCKWLFQDIFDMWKSLNQWRILANIYTGLCQGVFNMKFSNNWINGTLYHFKFAKKGRKLEDDGTVIPNPSYFYPDRVIWRQTDVDESVHYYYRSTPFDNGASFENQNNAIDGETENWPLNSHTNESTSQAHCGLNYPTTICNLGPLDPCITTICAQNNPDAVKECYYIDKLTASSYQNAEELLSREIERKIRLQFFEQFRWSGVNKWFGADAEPGASYNRNVGNKRKGSMGTPIYRGRVIDGDIAQLLATNSMAGISVFTRDRNDPYYGTGGGGGQNKWASLYGAGVGAGVTAIASIYPLLTRDHELINCLLGGSFGVYNTQVVPYYVWQKAGQGFGNLDNDYNLGRLGCTSCSECIAVVGYQQGNLYPAPDPTNGEGNINGNWTTPIFYSSASQPPPEGVFATTLPPPQSRQDIRLGTTLFYYFGLRQGASSYDRLLNEYLNPKEDE